jgi:GTP cyclohydrolase-4
MQMKKDLQYSSADEFGDFAIDRVGITDVKKRIDIHWKTHKYWMTANIAAFVRLPHTQRGIHMSRSAEMVEEAINMNLVKPAKSLEDFAKRLMDSLAEMHEYTNRVEVSIEGDLLLVLPENGGRQGQKPFELTIDAHLDIAPDKSRTYGGKIGLAAWGMTCCPCAQQMNIEYIQDMVEHRPDLQINSNQLDSLLKIIPVGSHNQRAMGRIQIGIQNLEEEVVDLLDLIEVIESSMSGRIQPVLKRPDEAELVRTAHLNPVFAEDAVRRMASQLRDERFSRIPNSSELIISIMSLESIHMHNVFAEIHTTFQKLRTNGKNGNS